ncbi:hypothetical protein [Clostridium algidicarnis]|uniref:hypothetical protein n=1 Tax=Clostridium algidicarnis TaxID=37659 RepID=UPI0004979E8D|nr:hypothetical protein [Clostridium algidicarnis]MBB6697571.1 hypothetical protein [Clostridium algidicarnis]MBU3194654.1 hypothetical protein [Clostridium algidicarnis]MBU3203341.1 hypothetical protein [Clostridium algidicarnis]MBU3211495.1 hypothetical protein [Clostridium algidicarnis]MBU3221997.1 hypothetical protein [Clostridium algidicarnis]
MFIECSDFYETETSFLSKSLNLDEIDLSKGKLAVKAHEKEIYCLSNELILAKVHRDNDGVYPFSKVDFLSHKLQEIIFPQFVPKIHFALFDNADTPMFVLQRIKLDKLHIAYNVQRQNFHKSNGRNFYYDPDFLKLDENDDIDELAKEHFKKINRMQEEYSYLIDKYGLAFDHSYVNITWKDNDIPISLEVHKCKRDYLFNLNKCKKYFYNLNNNNERKEEALIILNRIEQLL